MADVFPRQRMLIRIGDRELAMHSKEFSITEKSVKSGQGTIEFTTEMHVHNDDVNAFFRHVNEDFARDTLRTDALAFACGAIGAGLRYLAWVSRHKRVPESGGVQVAWRWP